MANSLYNHASGVPAAQTRGISSSLRSEFDQIAAAFDQVAVSVSPTITGYPVTPTPVLPTMPATKAYVDATAFAVVLPGQSASTAGKVIKSDGANASWQAEGLARVLIAGTTQTATSGSDYWATNAAATALTAPASTDGAKFAYTPANGLRTNTINFGAAVVQGPAGTETGVLTLDLGLRMEFEYAVALAKWVSK